MPQAKGIAYYLNHNVNKIILVIYGVIYVLKRYNFNISKEADYSLSNSIITPSKFQKVDFPSSFWYGSFSTLVPYPKEDTFDLSACLKPFSYMVGLLLTINMNCISYIYIKLYKYNN